MCLLLLQCPGLLPSARACNAATPGECVDGVSSAVVAPGALRAHGQGRNVESRHEVLTDDERQAPLGGVSAGEPTLLTGGWGLWFSRDHARFEGTGSVLPYDADSRVVSLGVDRLVAGRWVLGVALNHEDTQTRTPWNDGTQETQGLGVAPYAAWLVSDLVSVDASLGFSHTRTDQQRLGLDSLGRPERISGGFDNQRWFGALNLTLDGGGPLWEWSARTGYLYVQETQNPHAELGTGLVGQRLAPQRVGERRVHLGQAYLGGELALRFERLSPYAGAVYRHDIDRDSGAADGGLPTSVGDPLARDRDEVEFTWGARWNGDGVSAWVEFLHTLEREDFRNAALQASVHLEL